SSLNLSQISMLCCHGISNINNIAPCVHGADTIIRIHCLFVTKENLCDHAQDLDTTYSGLKITLFASMVFSLYFSRRVTINKPT
ncbi:hypothetical protein, partial [Photobacterium damselae]|uniref:hypothetical protein n=1 Tax=Photobacterium damselae TaxID=38293 RepID=UPI001C3C5509